MNCYIQDPGSKYDLPAELNKENTIFYPEARMSTNQLFTTSKPKEFHIVTDSPFLVPLYSWQDVFINVRGKWRNPEFQTYGCDYSRVMRLWRDSQPIPAYALNGKVTNCLGSKLTNK